MQFKDLDEKGYRQVCEFIAARATGVTVSDETVSIKRSGVRTVFMFDMLFQIIIEKDFADFCMGTRPYCNIHVAMKKHSVIERVDLKEKVDPDYRAWLARIEQETKAKGAI